MAAATPTPEAELHRPVLVGGGLGAHDGVETILPMPDVGVEVSLTLRAGSPRGRTVGVKASCGTDVRAHRRMAVRDLRQVTLVTTVTLLEAMKRCRAERAGERNRSAWVDTVAVAVGTSWRGWPPTAQCLCCLPSGRV
jgi:hypothetical protein